MLKKLIMSDAGNPLEDSSDESNPLSLRSTCRYCSITTRFYPYIARCKVCSIEICIGCIKSRRLYVRFLFGDEQFDEIRCHVHRDLPMRVTLEMYNRMTRIVSSGRYHSDSDSSFSETTTSTSNSSFDDSEDTVRSDDD